MSSKIKIIDGVFQIGGSNLTDPSDCSVYIIDSGNGESVLIDCGAGKSFDKLTDNIKSCKIQPDNIKVLILTHCHIDHIGSAAMFKEKFGCNIAAHKMDTEAIEGQDISRTAASWYGVDYQPVTVDKLFSGESGQLKIGPTDFKILHTPGHTPGSISVYCDRTGKRILFGQDIHGPFDPSFGSDIEQWKISMKKLLKLEADILCEGHFGVYKPKKAVRKYIESYLERY